MSRLSAATKLATMLLQRRRVLAAFFPQQAIYYCDMKRKKRRELWTSQSIQQQRFSGFRCNACVCMQNVIYDEAVQFRSAPRENCVFSCVNVRLELQLPSISAPKREASNQTEVHKSERDSPTACVQLLCCSGFKAV